MRHDGGVPVHRADLIIRERSKGMSSARFNTSRRHHFTDEEKETPWRKTLEIFITTPGRLPV